MQTPVAPLPVPAGPPARPAARGAFGPVTEWLAERQMGRHPRPADPARRRALPVVPRRRADDRPLPRTCAADRFPARGHGDRRRGAGLGPCRRDAAGGSRNCKPRIGRKTVPRKLLAEAPVIVMVYDLLEDTGRDIRALPLTEPSRAACGPSCPDTRHLADPPVCAGRRGRLDRHGRGPRHQPRSRRRGADAQTPRRALSRRAEKGRLVEMEARPADHRPR